MINGIIFDERLNTARDWGRIFKKAFPIDGVLHGFEVTGSGKTFSIAPGYIVVGGRVLQNDGALNVENTAVLQNGFVRLKYRIDLSAEPSREEFSQGGFVMDTSGSAAFPSLLQEDINGTGSVYEAEIAVFQIANGAIAERVRMMRPAGMDALYLLGEGESYFAIKKQNGQIRLLVRGEGSTEAAALKIDENGALATQGSLCVGSSLEVNGELTQTLGRATLNDAVTIRGPENARLTLRWAADRVAFDIYDGANMHENVMSINANGSVTIPVDVPGIQGKLDLNDDLVFTGANKGVYSTGGGSKKLLIAPGEGGRIWVGSTDDQYVSQEAVIAANNRAALMTFEPGKGFNAALETDGRNMAVNRNLSVGKGYNAAFGGDVSVGGRLLVTGGFGMDSLLLSGALDVAGDTALRKLTVGGDTKLNAVSMEGNLTLGRALSINGQYGVVSGNISMLSFINNILWLGSQVDSAAPSYVNLALSTQLNVVVGGVNMLRVDKEALDAFGKTIKTTGLIDAGSLKVGSFTPASVKATVELMAPTVRSTNWLKADGKLEVDGVSTFKGTILAETADITGQDIIASRNLWVKNMQRFYPRGTGLGYGATMEVDSNNYAFSLYMNPSAGSDSGRLQAIKIDRTTGLVSFPRGAYLDGVTGGLAIAGGLIKQGSSGSNLTIYGDAAGTKAGVAIAYGTGVVALPGVAAATATAQSANVYMSPSGTLYITGSTRRIKENIADADEAQIVDTLRRLRVRTYTSKNEPNGKKLHTGGIAEEFFAVDPRMAIFEEVDGKPRTDEGGEPLIDNIDTNELLYRLLAGFQYLDRKLANMEVK